MDINQGQPMNQPPMSAPQGSTNGQEPITVSGMDMSTHKIFGIPRRVIGFGFALFLILVILAFIYSQFADQRAMAPSVPQESMSPQVMPPKESGSMESKSSAAITGPVTPDSVTDDLIDEALSDRDVIDSYTADEMADVEDGSNY